MNSIKKILDINDKELASNTPDAASWHMDYADTSYVFIGNLDRTLKEADVLTIFSQYGNPTHINLVKDRDTGKSRGFCYLKYEDQRSCVLAVDNFNGTLIHERPLKVDHIYYKLVNGQQEDDFKVEYPEPKSLSRIEDAPRVAEKLSPPSASVMDDDNFEDPMANMVAAPLDFTSKRERSDKHRSVRHEREKSEGQKRHRSERDERHRSDKRREKRHRSERSDQKSTDRHDENKN